MDRIKHFIESDKGKDVLVVIVVILVGLGSFQLGRLSKDGERNSSGVKIEYPNQEASILSPSSSAKSYSSLLQNTEIENSVGKNFFASNRGSKYYSLGCSAGKTIKQENRVYFATSLEAERAGYELSSSCK